MSSTTEPTETPITAPNPSTPNPTETPENANAATNKETKPDSQRQVRRSARKAKEAAKDAAKEQTPAKDTKTPKRKRGGKEDDKTEASASRSRKRRKKDEDNEEKTPKGQSETKALDPPKTTTTKSSRKKRKDVEEAKEGKKDDAKDTSATPSSTPDETPKKRARGRPKKEASKENTEETPVKRGRGRPPGRKDSVARKRRSKDADEKKDEKTDGKKDEKKDKKSKAKKDKSKDDAEKEGKVATPASGSAQKQTIRKKRRSSVKPSDSNSDTTTTTTTTDAAPKTPASKTDTAPKSTSKKKKDSRKCVGVNAQGQPCGRNGIKKFDYLCHLHYIQKYGQDKYNEVAGKPPPVVPCAKCGTKTADSWVGEGKGRMCVSCAALGPTATPKPTAASATSGQKRKRKQKVEESLLAPPVKRVRRVPLDAASIIAPAVPVSSARVEVQEAPSISEKDDSLMSTLAQVNQQAVTPKSPGAHQETRLDRPLLAHVMLPPPVRANIFSQSNLMKHATAVHDNVWLQQQLSRYNPRAAQQPLQLNVLLYAFTFCDTKTLGRAALVSHMWNIASQDHVVWKYQYNSRWPISQVHLQAYVALPSRNAQRLSTLDDGIDWKDLYFTRAHLYDLGMSPIQIVEHMCRFYSVEANPQILDSIVDKAQMHRNYHHHVLSMQERRQKLEERSHLLDALRSIAGNTDQFLNGLVVRRRVVEPEAPVVSAKATPKPKKAANKKVASGKKVTRKSTTTTTDASVPVAVPPARVDAMEVDTPSVHAAPATTPPKQSVASSLVDIDPRELQSMNTTTAASSPVDGDPMELVSASYGASVRVTTLSDDESDIMGM